MKVERDSDTKYRGETQREEDFKAENAAFCAMFLSCFLPFELLGFCTQLLHPPQETSEHQRVSFPVPGWLVGQYTSALHRRALHDMDHGVN